MKFGFIIDNRKCIGCHACTVACKSEHDVAIGVNRTWVKQTEKGLFPNSRRVFSVLRCNHCTDAPCVEICPVEALYIREDGIVDFNNQRCIGCKSCMQACPYDALYIDPDTHTAAKCNYCAHRVDIGLEPACVNVCPEHAIISGDMDDPHTEISMLLSREQVTVRKPEKDTKPNLFYINGDEASLTPSATSRSDQYIWSSQTKGVGHFARFVEKLAGQKDPEALTRVLAGEKLSESEITYSGNSKVKSIDVLMEKAHAKRVYDTPDKGILWGWEVSMYVFTKALAAGSILLPFLAWATGIGGMDEGILWLAGISALTFITLTGLFLVMDLDQPKRFLYVLLRPQWNSWLVRGGYAITLFGGFSALLLAGLFFHSDLIIQVSLWSGAVTGVIVAIYTAFLFAQAKARDFWQSPTLVIHMFIHSLMAGSSLFLICEGFLSGSQSWQNFNALILAISTVINLLVMGAELTITHPTQDAKATVASILSGRYKTLFYAGIVLLGNILPLTLLINGVSLSLAVPLMTLTGIFITEKIWIEAPQRIPLT